MARDFPTKSNGCLCEDSCNVSCNCERIDTEGRDHEYGGVKSFSVAATTAQEIFFTCTPVKPFCEVSYVTMTTNADLKTVAVVTTRRTSFSHIGRCGVKSLSNITNFT